MARHSKSEFGIFNTLSQAFKILLDNINYFLILTSSIVVCQLTISLLFPSIITVLINNLINILLLIVVLDRTNASVNELSFEKYPYIDRWKQAIIPILIIYIVTGITVFLGLMLFVIPGLYILAALYMAPPIALAENVGFEQAMRKSWTMSEGRKFEILGIIFVPIMLLLVLVFVLMGGTIAQFFLSGISSNSIGFSLISIVGFVINGLFSIFLMVISGTVYHQIHNEDAHI